MLTRRQVLQRGAAGGAGLMLPWVSRTSVAPAAAGLKSYVTDLAPYFPPLAAPVATNGADYDALYALALRPRLGTDGVRVHAQLAGVDAWSYLDGPAPATYLGPTLVVPKGQRTRVEYKGEFGTAGHMFTTSIDKAVLDPYVLDPDAPEMRFMTHLHGAFVDGFSDGNPFATHWTNGDHASHEAGPNDLQTADYPPQERAALIWYHQHAHGITHLNVMAGLAGAYVLTDALDPVLPDSPGGDVATSSLGVALPAGRFHLPLVLQDRAFANGQFVYPPKRWVPEFFGDTLLVNGAVEPFLDVEARRYRLRLLNGSNARVYNLSFGTGSALRGRTPEMWAIGGDGGLLPEPVQVTSLVLAPGERADVIVDFGNFAGTSSDRVLLRNNALPAGIVSPARPLTTVMQFRITPPAGKDLSSKPSRVVQLTDDTWQRAIPSASKKRTMILEEVMGAAGPLASIVNYRSFEGRPVPPDVWMNPATAPRYPFSTAAHDAKQLEDTISNGTTEEWQFVNTTADTHPMHLHLVQFGLVKREALDVAAYTADLMVLHSAGDDAQAAIDSGKLSGKAAFDGGRLLPGNYILPGAPTVPIAPEESGWKDTVRANPGEVTTIRAKFDLKDLGGDHQDYVAHCHILEHESNSMMRAYRVSRSPGSS